MTHQNQDIWEVQKTNLDILNEYIKDLKEAGERVENDYSRSKSKSTFDHPRRNFQESMAYVAHLEMFAKFSTTHATLAADHANSMSLKGCEESNEIYTGLKKATEEFKRLARCFRKAAFLNAIEDNKRLLR